MHIDRVDCDVLVVRDLDTDNCDTAQDDAVVRVHTNTGLLGVGEVESNPWVIKALIESPSSNAYTRSLGELLLKEDPTDPEAIWDRLYRESFLVGRRGAGICALGALDMAVWDVFGKATGQPIWRLLASQPAKTTVVPYASLLPTGRTIEAYRESLLGKALWAVGAGYKAVKLEILIRGPFAQYGLQQSNDTIVDLVAAGRAAVGPDIDLMVDVGYCWADWREAAEVMRRLEKHDLFFVETPLMPDDLDGYAKLAQATGIPIAAGELLQTRFEFAELMDRGNVHVVQPDVGRVGGITEAVRVAMLARERGKLVVPHCWRSGIGIAASIHLAAVSAHCPYFEFLPAVASESTLRKELVENDPIPVDGRLPVPSLPGLGVKLNMAAFERFARFAKVGRVPENDSVTARRLAAIG